MAGIVRPDLHELCPDIQPEIVIHASECLTGTKRLRPDDSDAVHRSAARLEMQEQRRGAIAAANDAQAGRRHPGTRQRRLSAVAVNSSRAASTRSNMSSSSSPLITSGGQKPMMSPGRARRITPCS